MPYPDGVSIGTKRAPWNDQEAAECPDCQNRIHESSDHTEDCPLEGLNTAEIDEMQHERANGYDRYEL